MATDQFTLIIEPDGDAFHAYVPSLPGCHTFGATVEEARANLLEAVALHIESMAADGESPPPAAGHGELSAFFRTSPLAETPLDLRRDPT